MDPPTTLLVRDLESDEPTSSSANQISGSLIEQPTHPGGNDNQFANVKTDVVNIPERDSETTGTIHTPAALRYRDLEPTTNTANLNYGSAIESSTHDSGDEDTVFANTDVVNIPERNMTNVLDAGHSESFTNANNNKNIPIYAVLTGIFLAFVSIFGTTVDNYNVRMGVFGTAVLVFFLSWETSIHLEQNNENRNKTRDEGSAIRNEETNRYSRWRLGAHIISFVLTTILGLGLPAMVFSLSNKHDKSIEDGNVFDNVLMLLYHHLGCVFCEMPERNWYQITRSMCLPLWNQFGFVLIGIDRSISVRYFVCVSATAVLLCLVWNEYMNRNANRRVARRKFLPDSYFLMGMKNQHIDVISFGIFVCCFQLGFMVLMVASVIGKRSRTIGEVDNPGSGFFSGFIPANSETIVRMTQIISLVCYVFFADCSVLDVVTAIEMFPKSVRGNWNLALSCILRGLQGVMAILTVFLLVVTSSEVIDIVLNFAAVEFISALDNVAFGLARDGRFGQELEEQAGKLLSSASYVGRTETGFSVLFGTKKLP